MKSKKLNLNELKVKSFVTDFENEGKMNKINGGLTSVPKSKVLCGSSNAGPICLCPVNL